VLVLRDNRFESSGFPEEIFVVDETRVQIPCSTCGRSWVGWNDGTTIRVRGARKWPDILYIGTMSIVSLRVAGLLRPHCGNHVSFHPMALERAAKTAPEYLDVRIRYSGLKPNVDETTGCEFGGNEQLVSMRELGACVECLKCRSGKFFDVKRLVLAGSPPRCGDLHRIGVFMLATNDLVRRLLEARVTNLYFQLPENAGNRSLESLRVVP